MTMTKGTLRIRRALVTAFAMLAVVAIVAPSLRATPGPDPSTEPIPALDLNDGTQKAFRMRLHFEDRSTVAVQLVEVVHTRAPGLAGNPNLLRMTMISQNGVPLGSFDAWHPLWASAEMPGGGHGRIILPEATGRFVFPFDKNLGTVVVTDLANATTVATVDVKPALRDFCDENPDDPDCLEMDVAVLSVAPIAPPTEMVVGASSSFGVETLVTNLGPDAPANAVLSYDVTSSPGIDVTPGNGTQDVDGLAIEEERTQSRSYSATCTAPGPQTITFRSSVALAPVPAAATDPNPVNNAAEATVVVDCMVPVRLNIKPGSDPNSINLGSNGSIPVAVLTTAEGEYGLPVAFDASRIDPVSVRFGDPTILSSGGGATEFHDRGHPSDAYDMDERTRDGDTDMVLHFRTQATGLGPASVEGCIKGTFEAADGSVLTFFGCDAVRVVP